MGFDKLISALLGEVRFRVQNGQITERALARRMGVSQPHLHHILKGKRGLTPVMADRLLGALGLELTDLIESVSRGDGEGSLGDATGPATAAERPVFVPILEGLLGPGYPKPQRPARPRYLPVARGEVGTDGALAAVRVALDPALDPVLLADDLAVLLLRPLPADVARNLAAMVRVVEEEGSWVAKLPRPEDTSNRLTVPAAEGETGGEDAALVGVVVLSIRRMCPQRLPLGEGWPWR